jgi:hypothetical protein
MMAAGTTNNACSTNSNAAADIGGRPAGHASVR